MVEELRKALDALGQFPEGLADALLFHTCLFCLIGAQTTIMGTVMARAGHPAFILTTTAKGPQPVFLLELP
jgi:hypothetical protein